MPTLRARSLSFLAWPDSIIRAYSVAHKNGQKQDGVCRVIGYISMQMIVIEQNKRADRGI
jgi:hypothetical protein